MEYIIHFFKFALIGIILSGSHTLMAQSTGFEPISKAINAHDGSLLKGQMGDMVTITMENKSSIYSQAQSIVVLRDFLEREQVSQFKILQSGSKNLSIYAIGTMQGKSRGYLVYLYLEYNKGDDRYLIKEIKIGN